MMERLFRIKEKNTSVRTEILAGLTTFVTMAYIIFVQPSVMSGEFLGPGKPAGVEFMDKTGVMLATCIASALACFVMAFLANYPIALAPGMGENFFYGLIVAGFIAVGTKISWQTAMGVVFISGMIFVVISLFRVRETIVEIIPDSLKSAIALGIGLLIAFLGLTQAGVIIKHPSPGAIVKIGNMMKPEVAIAGVGLLVIGFFMVRKIKGGLLVGLLASAAMALILHKTQFGGVFAMPDFAALGKTAFKLDILGALRLGLVTIIVVFVMMDMFDTIGTLVGMGRQAGLMDENGKMPRVGRALLADAIGSVIGALLGTSTVTSYIESAAGIQQGGRTGLTAVVVGLLFILAMFIAPLMMMITGCVAITAPVLIMVGVMISGSAARIDWEDYRLAIPSFLIALGIPLTMSIADGMAFGFVSYCALMIFSGDWKKAHWLMYVIGVMFVYHLIEISKLGI
ncbi:MAG: NCS2 family permease [bacterium]